MWNLLKSLIPFGSKIADKIARTKASEEIILKYDSEGVTQARAHDVATGGWIVQALRGSVRPIGGHVAQSILFFNILAPYFGQERVQLDQAEFYLLGIIIAFFYGGRYFEVRRGR